MSDIPEGGAALTMDGEGNIALCLPRVADDEPVPYHVLALVGISEMLATDADFVWRMVQAAETAMMQEVTLQ
jgi:hypothetical protein